MAIKKPKRHDEPAQQAGLQRVRKAKEAVRSLVAEVVPVQGVGITRVAGAYAIKVMVLRAPARGAVPRALEGVPIIVQVAGAAGSGAASR